MMLFCGMESSLGQTIPEEARRHFGRGTAAVEMAKTPADYEKAITEFEKAKALAPNWADIHYNLGLLYEQVEQYDDAIRSLQKYLELNPSAGDGENVRQGIYKIEYKKKKFQDPSSLVGIWVQEDDKGGNNNRLEIRINKGRLEARVLPVEGWRISETPNPRIFIPDGEFVPAQWDGKILTALDATTYSCTAGVSRDNCPSRQSYHLQKVSDNTLKGEVKVKGHYYVSASGRRWVDDYAFSKTWIRK